jgi:hypothetical protein
MSARDDASDRRAKAAQTAPSGTDSIPAADVSPSAPRSTSRPAPRRRRRRRGDPELYYVGRRRGDARVHVVEVYVVDGTDIHRLAHRAHRSDEAFDWGSASPGALELAYAMLADCTSHSRADLLCQVFCSDVLAALHPDGFVLGRREIADWLRYGSQRCAVPDPRHAHEARAGLIRRTADWLRARLARSPVHHGAGS